MPFFGEELIEGQDFAVPIPEGYRLQITGACLDVTSKPSAKPVVFRVKTANDEKELNICVLHAQSNNYHANLSLEFGEEDDPVELSVVGGTVHVTGSWSWDEGCDQEGDEDDEEEEDDEDNEDEDEEEEEDDEEEAPELVPVPEKVTTSNTAAKATEKAAEKAEKAAEKTKEVTAKSSEPTVVEEKLSKKDKKRKAAEASLQEDKAEEPASKKVAKKADAAPAAPSSNLKPWVVHPNKDDGVVVPAPKAITKKDGLIITDHIIGKGSLPKPGAVVEILYEGIFPETGEIFDANLKRKKPFTFRKGLQQVIKGMEIGLEGMRVGGAREIFVPSALGYGSKGIGPIKGNQSLIFRIQLIGTH